MRRATRQRFWLVNLFFGTGAAPTGVVLESLARALQREGHAVEVVTGRGRYNAARASVERRFRGVVHSLRCG